MPHDLVTLQATKHQGTGEVEPQADRVTTQPTPSTIPAVDTTAHASAARLRIPRGSDNPFGLAAADEQPTELVTLPPALHNQPSSNTDQNAHQGKIRPRDNRPKAQH